MAQVIKKYRYNVSISRKYPLVLKHLEFRIHFKNLFICNNVLVVSM